MGNQMSGGNHVSVWDTLVFGFFEQKMGRACLKFGESYKLSPHLTFRTYCGLGVRQSCQVSQMWAG